jgi:hypothetical protein
VNTESFTVNITDGAVFVWEVAAYNNAHLEVNGGAFDYGLYLTGNATANVSGGSGFLLLETETAGERYTISGGNFDGMHFYRGSARVAGGTIGRITNTNTSNLVITGGSVKQLNFGGSGSTLALSGGNIGADEFVLMADTSVTVNGKDLSLVSPGFSFDTNRMQAYTTYSLGGTLSDGSAVAGDIRIFGEAGVTSNTGTALTFETLHFADDFVDSDATRSGVITAPYTTVGRNSPDAVTLNLNDALAFQLQVENGSALNLNGNTQIGGAYIATNGSVSINDDARINFGLQLGEGYTDANTPSGEQNGGFVANLAVGDRGTYVQNGGTIGTGYFGDVFLNSNLTATYILNGGTVQGGIYNYSGNVLINGGAVLGGIFSEFGVTDIYGGAVSGDIFGGGSEDFGGVVNVRGGDLTNAMFNAFGGGAINFYGSDFTVESEAADGMGGYEYRLTGLLARSSAPSLFTFRSLSGYGQFSLSNGVFSAMSNGTVAVVPEPTTIALFATGALCLIAPITRTARRNRK